MAVGGHPEPKCRLPSIDAVLFHQVRVREEGQVQGCTTGTVVVVPARENRVAHNLVQRQLVIFS